MNEINILSFTVSEAKEQYLPRLEDLCKQYNIPIPLPKSTALGLRFSFRFHSAEEKNIFEKAISDNIPQLYL